RHTRSKRDWSSDVCSSDLLARVTAAVSLPIMADEAVWSAADAHRLIEARACDLLNIKLAKTGGLRGAIEVADAARLAGIDCMLRSEERRVGKGRRARR